MKVLRMLMAATLIVLIVYALSTATEGGAGSGGVITSIPRAMTYQGILKNSDGEPVGDSTFNIDFRIYDDSISTTFLWSEVIPITTDDGGYFSANLTNLNLPFDVDYWLELQMTTQSQPMSPRQKISMTAYSARSDSSDYAVQAFNADLLGGMGPTQFALADHNHDTEYVNEGQPNSISNGMIQDNAVTSLNIEDATIQFSDIGQNAAAPGQVMKWNGTLWYAANDETGTGDSDWIIVGNNLYSGVSGNVGIGSTMASEKLDVYGTVNMTGFKMTTGAINGRVLTSDGAGQGTWQLPPDDLDWSRGTPDSILFTSNFLGIARGDAGNALFGDSVHTMINLGVACTTGVSGQSQKYGTIGGGYGNAVTEFYTTISGGLNNKASGMTSTISGGSLGIASGGGSAIGGGYSNEAGGGYASVGGGYNNSATAIYAAIGGGQGNTAGGNHAIVAGGQNNSAGANLSAVLGGISNNAAGSYSAVGGGHVNVASGNRAVVGGGSSNIASGVNSAVAGGYDNTATADYGGAISGFFNNAGDETADTAAFVGGGFGNNAIGTYSVVGGGLYNTASGNRAIVAGGHNNSAGDSSTTVSGGNNNDASGDISTISGGSYNTAAGDLAVVAGGYNNSASDSNSTVGGGTGNEATGYAATVGGGSNNKARGVFSVIGGGGGHSLSDSNSAYQFSCVSGGVRNNASSYYCTIGGGVGNTASGERSTVGGGQNNTSSGYRSTVSGGSNNEASGDYSTVGAGFSNTAAGLSGTVCGGEENSNSGAYSSIIGGLGDTLITGANFSMIFGRQVREADQYRVVFFNADYPGRFGLNRDDHDGGISHPIHVGTNTSNGNGAFLSSAGTWFNGSGSAFSEDFRILDGNEILSSVSVIPMGSWRSKDSEERHIGPHSEDFVTAFDVGVVREDGSRENQYLAASDMAGVALACIQALLEKVEKLEKANSELETRISELEKR